MSPARQYGPYILGEHLGQGNMGKVYLAYRADTRAQVAVKIIHDDGSPDSRENIELEEAGAKAEQEAAEKDSRVAVVNQIFRLDGDLVIEMEHVQGKLLSERTVSAQDAARIAQELCGMIETLASLQPGVLHCDLKPKNVVVLENGTIKVIDFGIAKKLTTGGEVDNPRYSPPYASPERLETYRVTVQSELWAVGVMLYEMTAGTHPFQSPDVVARVRRRWKADRYPVNSACPLPLRWIALKALEPRVENRYQSPREMINDLERFRQGGNVQAPDPEGTVRSKPPEDGTVRTAPPLPKPSVPAPAPQHAGFLRSFKSRFAVVILLLLMGSITWAWHRWTAISAQADTLRAELEAGSIPYSEGWTKYRAIRDSWVPTAGIRKLLMEKEGEFGDRVIAEFGQDRSQSSELNWKKAAESFQRMLLSSPNNSTLKGKLKLCEGHLHRIRATYRVNNRPNLNQAYINLAIRDFSEAEHLIPKSPDPYLGLARIYYYELPDLDRGDQMIHEAERRGHPAGRRERLGKADALRGRADLQVSQARRLADAPDIRERYLERARADYAAALNVYEGLTDYMPSVFQNIRVVKSSMDQIDTELSQPNPTK